MFKLIILFYACLFMLQNDLAGNIRQFLKCYYVRLIYPLKNELI